MVPQGFQLRKSPMPTYRPDVFAEKCISNGRVAKQIVVEAEIESTIFSEHTAHQLLLMDEFIRLQGKKHVRVRGYLLVPKTKRMLALANSALRGLFAEGTKIKVFQLR